MATKTDSRSARAAPKGKVSRSASAAPKSKVSIRITGSSGLVKTQFGSVVTQGPKVPRDLYVYNVKAGSASLKRAAKTVVRPGVALRAKKGVPQFFVDSDHQGFFMRKLDGKIERGQVIDGKFTVVD